MASNKVRYDVSVINGNHVSFMVIIVTICVMDKGCSKLIFKYLYRILNRYLVISIPLFYLDKFEYFVWSYRYTPLPPAVKPVLLLF